MKQFFKMVFASCLGVLLASVAVMALFFFFLVATIMGAVSSIGRSQSSAGVFESSSALLLDLKGTLSDRASYNPFDELGSFGSSSGQRTYTLPEVLEAIELAERSPKIEAIVLKLDDVSMGFAAAHELREALARFKEAKTIYAYCGDQMSYGSYYVSTIADRIFASPEASLPVVGLASNTVFYKGVLAKLGIDMQIFKVGTYKGAVEPFMLSQLSPENRMQIQSYLDELWRGTLGEMAAARNVTPEAYQDFADRGLFLAHIDSAMHRGFVDSLVYATDIDDQLAKELYATDGDDYGEWDADDLVYVRVEDVLASERSYADKGEMIALVYAEGDIVEQVVESNNPFADTEPQITTKLAKQLRELAEDDDIKAVVLRVNSPGGSARTSELITRELQLLKETKPVVISMGNYAASGGYYISSNASLIVADPYTLTGSIGIFGMFPNATEAARKLAVTHDVVKTSEMADMGNLLRPMEPVERAAMQRMIEEGYDKFLTRVSAGRGMTKLHVDSVGQGRVWLGQQALELGLVDKQGGLRTALDEAARLAGIDGGYSVYVDESKPSFMDYFMDINAQSMLRFLTLRSDEQALYEAAREVMKHSGVQARPLYSIQELNTTTRVTPGTLVGR